MSRAEIATRALVLTLIVATIVGGYSLVPVIRAERFAPVVLEAPKDQEAPLITVNILGDVEYPGLYTLDASISLADMMGIALGEAGQLPKSTSLVIGDDVAPTSPQRIDLNHADAWLLDALPGIGPEKAQAIVAFRDQNGPFATAQELVMVPGFGEATYEALKEFVTVTP